MREPYKGKLFKPKLTNKILKPGDTVEVKSRFKENIVVIDSLREEHCLAVGETVKIKLSKYPLSMIEW